MHDAAHDVVRCEQNPETYAVIDRVGARITQFVSQGHPCLTSVHPLPGTPASIWAGCFAMAPFCGLLPDRTIRFGGREYAVRAEHDGDLVHGLTHDLAWEGESPAHLAVELPDSWPFGGLVRQRVEVTDRDLTVTVTVENEHRSMPASSGFHPWLSRLNRAGERATLDMNVGSFWAMDERGLPMMERSATEVRVPHPMDHQVRLRGSPSLHWSSRRDRAALTGDPTRLIVKADTDLFIIYEHDPGAICVEPITSAIGALCAEGPPVVEPGAPLSLTMSISTI